MEDEYLGDSQSSEHSALVTPKRSSYISTPKGTPGRKKLVLDDEADDADGANSSASKKKVLRNAGGGLRQFSVMVSRKLEAKKRTTYKEVADEIIAEFAAAQSNPAACSEEFNEKNIRRRVYDALNVLMALDIITRDKKEIRWKGLPKTCTKDLEELKAQRNKLLNSIEKKAAFLKDLEEQVAGVKNLIQRNHQIVKRTKSPTEGFTLPFILVQTSSNATVEVEISEDMQLVHFDFNSTPFSLHDDAYILKLMHNQKMQKSMHLSQGSSVHSSSSSCVASGSIKPFYWNSETGNRR